MEQHSSRRPLVLVASDGEWAGRSFESVLEAHDYAVQRATSGRRALERARVTPPDAVIVDEQLADMHAPELLRRIRDELPFGRATPTIVTSSAAVSPRERMGVYAAGAWDYCSQPLDVDVLLLKLKTFVGARMLVRQLDEQALVDVSTDMYSRRGIQRWSRELVARAVRRHEPFTAVALKPTVDGHNVLSDSEPGESWARTAEFMSRQRRASDIIGYIGEGTFVVLAPETDANGASHFIDRLQRAAAESALVAEVPKGEVPLSVGYWAAEDLADTPLPEHDDVIGRATAALSHIRRTRRVSGVVSFDELSTG
jgi:PleD family two-component response regulator